MRPLPGRSRGGGPSPGQHPERRCDRRDHSEDAERLGIEHGERVAVFNRRGSITATAHVGGKVSEGEVWMPFHFPDSPVNRLTNAALDEFARIPEYKVCAVRVEKLA